MARIAADQEAAERARLLALERQAIADEAATVHSQ